MLRVRNELAAKRRKARHYGVQALYKWHMIGGDPGEIVLEFCDEYDFINVDVEYFFHVVRSLTYSVYFDIYFIEQKITCRMQCKLISSDFL